MSDERATTAFKDIQRERETMGARNRVTLERAIAAGADTWLREGFVREDDGTVHVVKQSVPTPDPAEPVGWKQKFVDDDGRIYYDDDAARQAVAYWGTATRHNKGQPPRKRTSGHAPRERTNARHRGSRRASASTSSSSDDPPGDPESPRLCGCGCGESISHLRLGSVWLTATHRQAGNRARKAAPELDSHRHDPYLDFEYGEYDWLKKRAGCGCNGSHIPDHDRYGTGCVKCGRAISWNVHPDVPFDGVRVRPFVEAPLPVNNWKTHPRRGSDLAAKLRRGRGRWDMPRGVTR